MLYFLELVLGTSTDPPELLPLRGGHGDIVGRSLMGIVGAFQGMSLSWRAGGTWLIVLW